MAAFVLLCLGGGTEPNGDNSTKYRLYKVGYACECGQWNGAHNAVAKQAYVFCLPNGKLHEHFDAFTG